MEQSNSKDSLDLFNDKRQELAYLGGQLRETVEEYAFVLERPIQLRPGDQRAIKRTLQLIPGYLEKVESGIEGPLGRTLRKTFARAIFVGNGETSAEVRRELIERLDVSPEKVLGKEWENRL